jgi:hypothetical protein
MYNSRIEELINSLGIIPEDQHFKIAELIITECVAQCEKNKNHEWLGSGSKLSAFNIKQYFGSKEPRPSLW